MARVARATDLGADRGLLMHKDVLPPVQIVFDFCGSPAGGRQKSPLRGPADCRRGEDTPEAPRAFADPRASRQEAPSASAGNAGSTPPRSTPLRERIQRA